MRRIDPALRNLELPAEGEQRLWTAIETNVRWSLRQLRQGAANASEAGAPCFVGGRYSLRSGAVRFLDMD